MPCFPVEDGEVIENMVEGEDDGWVETTIKGKPKTCLFHIIALHDWLTAGTRSR